MSDEIAASDAAARAELEALRRQFDAVRREHQAVTAERDARARENSELNAKAAAVARDLDGLRARLVEADGERARLLGEKGEVERKAAEAAQAASRAQAAAAEATSRAQEALGEVARLRHVIETTPSAEPLEVLRRTLSENAAKAVAWTREKIPADGPWRDRFDQAIDIALKVGCLIVAKAQEFLRWATPRIIELAKAAKGEIEARLAKK